MLSNRPDSIKVDVNGQDLVFHKYDRNWGDLENKNYVFFNGVEKNGQIDNSTMRINQNTLPDYIFSSVKTSELVYEKLDKCQLLILCLLSAESFYRVENNRFAKDPSVFKTAQDPSLREMTVNQLLLFIRSKSDTYWIKNYDAFSYPHSMLIDDNTDPSWMAKWTWALHINELTKLVFKKFKIVSFNHIIDELRENCSVNETIMKTYISYGQVVVYKCYQEVIEGHTRERCYAMLAKTKDINYQSESQLKIVWGD